MAKRKRGIKVVEQRSNWDCGVACLGMLLPVSYAELSAAARTRFPKVRKFGMAIYEMIETAELFNHKLKKVYKKKGYLENQTGVLGILAPKGSKHLQSGGHWVVLKDGTHIVDPWDGTVWKLDDYLSKTLGRTATLLIP